MTIPAPVRLPLLLAGPAALAALAGLVPGRSFGGTTLPPLATRLVVEAVPILPGLVLVALIAISHAYERRGRSIVDAIASAVGLAGIFAATVTRIEGVSPGLRALSASLAQSPVARSAVLCAAAAGFAVPLIVSLGEFFPTLEGRWVVRFASLPAALVIALGWLARPDRMLARLAVGQNRYFSWDAEWPIAAAGASLVVLFTVRELAWSRILLRELSEEVTLGIVPITHVAILASPWRRQLSDWWPERSERRVYVEAVLRLAWRKVQMRGLPATSRRIGQLEVLRLRERIRSMLAPVEPPLEETLGGPGESRAPRVIELSR